MLELSSIPNFLRRLIPGFEEYMDRIYIGFPIKGHSNDGSQYRRDSFDGYVYHEKWIKNQRCRSRFALGHEMSSSPSLLVASKALTRGNFSQLRPWLIVTVAQYHLHITLKIIQKNKNEKLDHKRERAERDVCNSLSPSSSLFPRSKPWARPNHGCQCQCLPHCHIQTRPYRVHHLSQLWSSRRRTNMGRHPWPNRLSLSTRTLLRLTI